MILLLLALAAPPFVFKDVAEESGLLPHVAGIRGHAAAWGDVDGGGYPSLYVGTFHNAGSKPGMLLRNEKGRFRLDKSVSTTGIGSGALFADLTNSGRPDLYAATCAHGRDGVQAVPSVLLRNDGGKFSDASADSGACPPNYSGRGLAALDADGDGLLDLVLTEQYYSSNVKTGLLLLRNKGKYRFESKPLLPGQGGLAVAVGDVNGDGWPDVFLSHGAGDHRLLLNDGKGGFAEAPGTREVFRWKDATSNDPPAGVCIADVNRDGLPDVVIGNHFKSPWSRPGPVRLYLNRGVKAGVPRFEDVTEAAGLTPLAMKAPHVEVQDFDNDGWPDVYVSIVKFKDGVPHPVIFRGLGEKDGIPRFKDEAWAVNDFPTPADRVLRRSGPLFDKLLKEKSIIYMAAAPSADFDRDGRLDLFLASWWVGTPSLLLRNQTPGGNWLDVRVEGPAGVNRMGVGSRVNLYAEGKLVGSREIAIGYGFCSGQEPVAHFGLGKLEAVDVEVLLPHGKGTLTRKAVKANQRVVVGR
jgi:hypothetical protein